MNTIIFVICPISFVVPFLFCVHYIRFPSIIGFPFLLFIVTSFPGLIYILAFMSCALEFEKSCPVDYHYC